MLSKVVPQIPKNPHFSEEPVRTPTSGDLFPYLPTSDQYENMPVLGDGSVPIPTFMRYKLVCNISLDCHVLRIYFSACCVCKPCWTFMSLKISIL